MAQPVIQDQQTAARAYFFCIIGMLVCESAFQLPAYIRKLVARGRPDIRPSKSHSRLRVLIHKLSLIPSPLPFLEKHDILDHIRFLVFAAFNILFGYNRIQYTTDYKLYGWLALANSSLTLLFGARTNLFSLVLRIPSPVLLHYHRLIGRATLVHATLHFGLTADHYIKTDQFLDVLANSNIQAGLVAWCSLCIIVITSIGPIRRRFFEVFYYSHIFALVFVLGALVHAVEAKEFLLPGLILWVLDRAIRFANNFRTLRVQSVVHHQGDVTKIKVEGLERSHPGQIAWVQIPGVSFLNWHPFTIASAPEDGTATFAIRGLGGFTKKVENLADEKAIVSSSHDELPVAQTHRRNETSNFKMRIDGPYGTGSIEYEQYPVVALVAGGIGITPGMSIASHILRRATAPDARNNRWHIHMLWAVKDIKHVSWFEEELRALDAMALSSAGRATFDLTIFETSRRPSQGGYCKTEDPESAGTMEAPHVYMGPGEVRGGRPDLEQWFKNIATIRLGMDAAVNLCGPRSLTRSARKAAAAVSGGTGLFHVEEEVFEL